MDTMITAEKHNQCPNVINCYRKILGNKYRFMINLYFILLYLVISLNLYYQ